MLRFSKSRLNLLQKEKKPSIVSKVPKKSKDDINRVSNRYRNSLIYKKTVQACKGKKLGSSRKTLKTKCSIESNSPLSSLGMRRPKFYHPKKKILIPESSPSMESDLSKVQFELKRRESLESSQYSYNSELSLLAKPTENEHISGEHSTFDSFNELQLKNHEFKYLRKVKPKQEECEILPGESEEEEEESDSGSEIDYTNYPNYHEFKHFETEIDDDSFIEIATDRLSKIKGDLNYKLFKKELLPQHRKPTFSDYLRFRRLEKIMLKN